MKCEVCHSDEGIDPYDTGFVMCMKCFEKGIKDRFANMDSDEIREAVYGPNPLLSQIKE